MSRHKFHGKYYDDFGQPIYPDGCRECKQNCNGAGAKCSKCQKKDCGEAPCGCTITLTTDCVKYTGQEKGVLKKNKTLTNILKDLNKEDSNSPKYLFMEGVNVSQADGYTIVSIDQEWLEEFVNNIINNQPAV